MYVVETEAINTGIPYADAFTVCNHYRLSQGTDGRTNLTVWSHVKYRKTIWGIVKGEQHTQIPYLFFDDDKFFNVMLWWKLYVTLRK